jgi:host factor-I protein
MIFAMDVMKEESRQAVEPEFLSQALSKGIRLRIAQMNKLEQEGVVREIGRYEINFTVNGKLVTLLKRDLSYLTVPHPIFSPAPLKPAPAPSETMPKDPASASARPNIQTEFLDKAIRENHTLTVHLINGRRIKGALEAFDSFTLLLREGDQQHLFYKHAVTTIDR